MKMKNRQLANSIPRKSIPGNCKGPSAETGYCVAPMYVAGRDKYPCICMKKCTCVNSFAVYIYVAGTYVIPELRSVRESHVPAKCEDVAKTHERGVVPARRARPVQSLAGVLSAYSQSQCPQTAPILDL